MEAFLSSVKRKIRYSDSSGSSQEISPAEKRLKEFSFDHADEDEVMAAELAGKIDLILSKFEKLDTLEKKLEEVCSTMNIEFQRVHRLGNQPRSDGSGRMIIARFLRYSDREKVIRCAYKLKGTDFKRNCTTFANLK